MKLLFVSLLRPSILPVVGPDVLSTLFWEGGKKLSVCVLSSKSAVRIDFSSSSFPSSSSSPPAPPPPPEALYRTQFDVFDVDTCR